MSSISAETIWIASAVFITAVLFELYVRAKNIRKKQLQKPHSKRINKAFAYFRSHPDEKLTNDAWQRVTKVSDATATRDLIYLVEVGALKKKGSGRGIYYSRN
ncbi:MAG: hypothetical protein A3F94_00635 [Candidatus Spechtbacteria bacterium RIFCSPLOWO2_12_FULL_38_22]|uniref:HTH deoR-type domain-containing protein n=1 Tax=Candidatus Spechtbacteria bacterium RIFCSPLOWO2_12_FULL_38_22 TaxID=1802165 RepID=A0A1G2HHZ4_9BACT|nr:MAG: hypothetical protein A2728_02840 [Candidatus Spechtbacteria bacterium RIFCSPHIGHO2_01_FULL_38_11]OGZ59632.1 MAG: hypothetical protein A3A00_00325 [Candidatus Spechtbacteria bacterium RIFCSPLOWO2_01_FULL_38_20]OGZ60024.1 MAG: hypothetical protein A3E58_01610 [Candidatus Spechtbacteria bacterium RIFCSPHIGHO2_12_FULL_38_30]OGZ61900.1 MAG: hypothetical protein A3F94_00635 [Candidatus Spechtbacteria bacterium RIFCSPLOWO2_12_FULL_38_22]